MSILKILSVTYTIEMTIETIDAILGNDLIEKEETLACKLEKIDKVLKVTYPLGYSTKLYITIKINEPKEVKLSRELTNQIFKTISDHLK